MLVLLLLFVLICLWQVKLAPADNSHYMADYMSIEKTMAIKGIFILIVFFSHFNTYVDFTSSLDITYNMYYKQIGQRMVTLFMLYSGYGVMEAIKKKKMQYVHKIPVTRVIGTLFRFDIAVLLFLIMHLLLKTDLNPKRVLLALTSWDSIGNSNWYIFSIIVCYVLTFVAFEVFRDKLKHIPSALLLTVLVLAYIAVFRFKDLRPDRYYNTIFCYVLGVWLSIFKDKFSKLFGEYDMLWTITFLASSAVTVICWRDHSRFYMYEICMFSFTLAVVLFSMRVSLNNKILRWFGEHLFSVYMMQRIPMIVLKQVGLAEWNVYVYFVSCLVITVILAYAFDKLVNPLWAFITKPKKKVES